MNFEKIKTLKLVIFTLLCCPTVTVQSKQLLHIGTPKPTSNGLVDDVGSDDAQWFPTGKNLAVSEFGGMWIFYLYY